LGSNLTDPIVTRYTLAQAIELASKTPPRGSNTSRSSVNDGWAGGTFDEAIEMASNGYHHGAARLNERVGLLAKVRKANRPQAVWDTSGSQVDMGRFMTGVPESMISVRRRARQSPVIKIGIERVVSAYVSTEDIEATGASVLAAVESLRLAGIPSEIWATFTSCPSGSPGDDFDRNADDQPSWVSMMVKIQEPSRPIDLDRLGYWTMHPTLLRRIGFSMMENCYNAKQREWIGIGNSRGYGIPSTLRGRESFHDFDELAPAKSSEVDAWLDDVLNRRTGIQIKVGEY